MWASRLFWKLVLVSFGLNVVVAVIFLLIFSNEQARVVHNSEVGHVKDLAYFFQSYIENTWQASPDNQDYQSIAESISDKTDIRLTILEVDGDVLADTDQDPQKMDNHLDREEVKLALKDGEGFVERYSDTISRKMSYFAVPVVIEEQTVCIVRTSLPLSYIEEETNNLRVLIWSFSLIAAIVSFILSYFVVGRIIQPLSDLTRHTEAIAGGDYYQRVISGSLDEIGKLGDSFEHMRIEILQRIDDLESEHQRLSTLLGNMREGVIAVDSNQKVLFANNASRTMLDVGEQNIENIPLLEFVRHRGIYETVLEALERKELCKKEIETSTSPQRTLSVRATILPGDLIPGVLIVLHDITELRKLERLRQDFVANVSHELKTPLASVIAYSETLLLGAIDDPENNRQFVQNIEEQAKRLHELILDLLRISSYESGEEVFEIERVALQEIVSKNIRHCSEANQAKIKTEFSEKPIEIFADAEGMYTIVSNLLSNALKYTEEDGEVMIRCYEEGEQAVLEVEDNGVGISPADQERVFERFFRVDKARSRELGGTGLGLSIVKHLINSFNGTIELESELGEGSKFRIRLPLV